MIRAAVDRRDQEARGVPSARPRRRRRRRGTPASPPPSRRTRSRPARRPPPARRRRAAGRSARPGVASTTRVGLEQLRRGRSGRRRARSRSAVRRSSRTVAPVRTVERAGGERARPARPSRPASPANTGYVATAGGSAAAGPAASRASTQRDQLGHGGPRRERARVAGVHPAEQRLDQPVDHLVAEPVGRPGRRPRRRPRRAWAAAPARRATRASPSVGQHAGRARAGRGRAARPSASAAAGAARRGSRSATRRHAGCTTVEPQRAGQVDALGAPVEHRLRADVDDHPGDLGAAAACRRRGAPPRARATSCPARPRSRAAVSPAMPPPTTTVRRWVTRPACQTGRAAVRTLAARHRSVPGGLGWRGVSGGFGQPAEAAAVEDQRQSASVVARPRAAASSTIVWSPASTSR